LKTDLNPISNGVDTDLFNPRNNGKYLLDKFDLPDKVLLRKDGTSIYITQDIYLAYLKKKDFDYDESIYVVGNEQDLYFKQLFAILELIGFKEQKYHLSYGMISLPEGKMKSREGTVVDADDLMDHMIETAKTTSEELGKLEGLSAEDHSDIITKVALGALKYFILFVSCILLKLKSFM